MLYQLKEYTILDNLANPENPEHKFVDWEKGTSPDGKYLYLKQGINDETGNPWG